MLLKKIQENIEVSQLLVAIFGGVDLFIEISQALNAYKNDIQHRLISHSQEILRTIHEKPGLHA